MHLFHRWEYGFQLRINYTINRVTFVEIQIIYILLESILDSNKISPVIDFNADNQSQIRMVIFIEIKKKKLLESILDSSIIFSVMDR